MLKSEDHFVFSLVLFFLFCSKNINFIHIANFWIQSTWEQLHQPMTSNRKFDQPISPGFSPDFWNGHTVIEEQAWVRKHHAIVYFFLKKHVNIKFIIVKVNVAIYFEIWILVINTVLVVRILLKSITKKWKCEKACMCIKSMFVKKRHKET